MNETVAAIENEIKKLNTAGCIIAIDGRCASGKSTLAKELSNVLDCNIVHMDDFFLQPAQRTQARLNEAGGNIDYERFLTEIAIPLKQGKNLCYRRFDCHSLGFSDEIKPKQQKITIIEGTYSCHPRLAEIYDLKIFLDADSAEQLSRIEKRNGKKQLSVFKDKWIPLEERYFRELHIKEKCDISFKLKF